MQTNSRHLSVFLFFLSLLFGGWVRFWPLIQANFPIHDGGLFYVMMLALRENGWMVPDFVIYNGVQIPFAYPPLGFYIGNLLAALTGLSLLDVLRFYPALAATLTILAFYFLAREILPDEVMAGLATLFFALIPNTYVWLVMGGGITRATGLLFGVVTLWAAYRLFHRPGWGSVLILSLCATLLVLSHPETTFHIALSALVMLVFFGRSKRTVFFAGMAGGLIILSTAWWWLPVLQVHGWGPFAAALSARERSLVTLLYLFQFNLTAEPLLTLAGVFGALGLLLQLARRQYFLPAWLLIDFLLDSRSAPLVPLLPLSLLAGYFVQVVFLPALARGGHANWFDTRPGKWGFGLILVYLFMSALIVSSWLSHEWQLSPGQRAAMQWVRAHTPDEAVFAVLTGGSSLGDPVSEWFPVLTGRISVATIQGAEWLPAQNFMALHVAFEDLQACRTVDATCLQEWQQRHGRTFDYVYVLKLRPTRVGGMEDVTPPVWFALRDMPEADMVFDSDEVSVIRLRP